jgi:anaerobic ribonucleoside-triphosphate reductase activating protein
LVQRAESDPELKYILSATDFLIDGPYIKELRDITLKMRGSSNQRIIDLTKK